MPEEVPTPHRPWPETATQADDQGDLKKTADLAQDLIRALDAESSKRMNLIDPEEKVREKGAA